MDGPTVRIDLEKRDTFCSWVTATGFGQQATCLMRDGLRNGIATALGLLLLKKGIDLPFAVGYGPECQRQLDKLTREAEEKRMQEITDAINFLRREGYQVGDS